MQPNGQEHRAVRLRRTSNWLWGYICSWSLWLIAVLFFNPSALVGPDASPSGELSSQIAGILLVSVCAQVILARPFLEVADGLLIVRNPLVRFEIPITSIRGLRPGVLGFPQLEFEGGSVRLMALESTLAEDMRGQNTARHDLGVLLGPGLPERASGSRSAESQEGVVRRSFLPLSPGLLVLLAAWALFFLWFLF